MKRLIIIISLIISSIVSYGACLPPMIQAVCEIVKTDGSKVQGYLMLGINYDCTCIYMNGFFSYSDSLDKVAYYFNLDLKSIEFDKIIMFNRFGGHGNGFPRKNNIKYMVWLPDPSNYDTFKQKLNTENGKLVCNISSNRGRKYILQDSIRIYHELDEFACVPFKDNSRNHTDIALSDIAKISLLEKKDISNLSEIIQLGIDAEKRAKLKDEMDEDFQLPIWYHDIIINDPIFLKHINEAIEHCTLTY